MTALSPQDDMAATLQARMSWPQAEACAADLMAMFRRRMRDEHWLEEFASSFGTVVPEPGMERKLPLIGREHAMTSMTGAEHYRAGEQALKAAADVTANGELRDYHVQAAQAHFAAAAAAALIAAARWPGMTEREKAEWQAAVAPAG